MVSLQVLEARTATALLLLPTVRTPAPALPPLTPTLPCSLCESRVQICPYSFFPIYLLSSQLGLERVKVSHLSQ